MTTATTTPNATEARAELRGTKTGLVVGDKRDKTRTVEVAFQVRHPKYGKYMHRRTRLHVHDPKNESKFGDRVEIAMCRPMSKTKNWRLVRVVSKGQGVEEHKTEA